MWSTFNQITVAQIPHTEMVGACIEMIAKGKRIAEELPLLFKEIPEQSLYELVWPS